MVQFYGFGTVRLPDDRIVYYLVVERLEGGTLSQRLGSESHKKPSNVKLPLADILAMLLALAEAMHFLHEGAHERYTIVHRDLKPDNIGFDQHGTLKVFDFGLSCVVPKPHLREVALPITGQTGSVRYMAPEVALDHFYNEAVDVSHRAVACPLGVGWGGGEAREGRTEREMGKEPRCTGRTLLL